MFDEIEDQPDKPCLTHVIPRDVSSIPSARSKLRRRPALFFEAEENGDYVKSYVQKLNKSIKDSEENEENQPLPMVNSKEESEEEKDSIDYRNSFEAALEERLHELEMVTSYLSDTDSSTDLIEADSVEERKLNKNKSKSTENLISMFLTADELSSNTLANVKQLLNHENQHLSLLKTIEQYKYILLELKVSKDVIWNIFYNISDLIYAQQSLVNYLESITTEWENKPANFEEIMDLYTLLHIKCKDYVKNMAIAIPELKSLFDKNEKFRKAINTVIFDGKEMQLQDLILKPTNWLCNSLEHIKSLVDMADGECDRLKLEECLRNLKSEGCQVKTSKKGILKEMNLMKSSLCVEQKANDHRKLRHFFLFSGLVVCAQQKLHTECTLFTKHSEISLDEKHSANKSVLELKSIDFEVKWFIPLTGLVFHLSRQLENNDRRKNDITFLKDKIRQLKLLLISEKTKLHNDGHPVSPKHTKRSENFPFRKMMVKKDLEKISHQILKIQNELLLISPILALVISNGPEKPHTILFPSVKDLEVWKCEILKAQKELKHNDCTGMSFANVNFLVDNCRKDPWVIEVATRPLSNDVGLSGTLITNIHKVCGLNPEFRYYLSIEVDSFKLNELKARTKSCNGGSSLSWNENLESVSFDIDLDCSQTMSVLLYELKNYGENKESLVGYFDFQFNTEEFNNKLIKKSVPMLTNESVKMTIEISFKFVPKTDQFKRQPSITKTALFGISLKSVVAREKIKEFTLVENVPTIMVACFERIEKDLDEEGIYRISGSKNEINALYKRLNKNAINALKILEEYDLHTITGIIKMYLRELPEPLMMTDNYEILLNIAQLGDETARFKRYGEVIENLPEPNHSTLIYLLKHFERVCSHSSKNQMIAGNLALILGPTLIMPSSESYQPNFNEINIPAEMTRSFLLARIFTQIMHGVCKGNILLS